MDNELDHSQRYQWEYLRIIFETVAYLGKQNITFQGSSEDRTRLIELSDVNRGHFLETLYLQTRRSQF